MKSVVLVGGEGTRLRPLTLTAPKQMLPIVGVPMIERVLGHLASHGVDEAVLSLGYLPDAFLKAYPDGQAAGVRLTYAVEPEPLDTAGAIRFAAASAGIDETFVVVNGDVLTDLDLTGLVAFHRHSGAEGTIALHPVTDPSAFGVVPTDAGGPGHGLRREAATRRGAHQRDQRRHLRARAVRSRRGSRAAVASPIERETFPAMVRDGRALRPLRRRLLARHGTPAAYLEANFDYVTGVADAEVAPGLDGRGSGCSSRARASSTERSSGASSSSPAAGSRPAPGWSARMLGPGSVVESGAVVIDSVLMDGCHVAARRQGGGVRDGSAIHRRPAGGRPARLGARC